MRLCADLRPLTFISSGGRSKAKQSKCIKCDGSGTTITTQPVCFGYLFDLRPLLFLKSPFLVKYSWAVDGLLKCAGRVRIAKGLGNDSEKRIGMPCKFARILTCSPSPFWIRCKKCKGNKTTKEKKAVDLIIERGMAHNQKIVLKGEGDQQVCWC